MIGDMSDRLTFIQPHEVIFPTFDSKINKVTSLTDHPKAEQNGWCAEAQLGLLQHGMRKQGDRIIGHLHAKANRYATLEPLGPEWRDSWLVLA